MLARVLLPAVACLALGGAVSQMAHVGRPPSPEPPPAAPAGGPGPFALVGAGLVEPEGECVAVGTHLPGIVKRVCVNTGQSVRPGEPLFLIDDTQLKAELTVRRAVLAQAGAAVARLEGMP